MSLSAVVLAAVLPFLFVLMATPAVSRIAYLLGAIDKPDSRKVHKVPTPRLGGLGIVVVVLGFLVSYVSKDPSLRGVLIGALIISAVGIVDDIKRVSAGTKFLFQFAAAIVVVGYGFRVDFLTSPFDGIIATDIFAVPLTLLWIVGVTNAVNLLDGLDGLASGVISVSGLTLALIGWYQGVEVAVVGGLALSSATAAFLKYNSYPASIFLGDTGALFSGYLLAVLSMIGMAKGATFVGLVVPIFILGVPIFDTLTTMARRFLQGKPIFQPDRGHLHHKLMDSGLGHVGTVYFVYIIAIVSGLVAVIISRVPILYYLICMGCLLIVMVGTFDGGLTRLAEYVRHGTGLQPLDEAAATKEDRQK